MNANAETTENAAGTAQGAKAAPEQTSSKKKARKGAKPAATKKAAKASGGSKKPAAKKANKAKTAATPREGSKKQIVIELLSRKGGATMDEITEATGWQKHSIRGFISGTLMKKMDLPIASLKNEGGERVYRLEK